MDVRAHPAARPLHPACHVLKGVVDRVRAAGEPTPTPAARTPIIEGRCIGKYLQVTACSCRSGTREAILPTALTFGSATPTKKVGGNRPYDIFRYLVRKYTYGAARGRSPASGIPNSRYWLDYKTRFARAWTSRSRSCSSTRTRRPTRSSAWRSSASPRRGSTSSAAGLPPPGWDTPVAYRLHRRAHRADLDRGDVDVATYVEVIPAGDPGIDSATAQALRAGRAPVPSSYLTPGGTSWAVVSPGVRHRHRRQGPADRQGPRNHWYKLQRRLGVRPQQITSPLLFTQAQAQAQAEGLLRFYSRMVKGGTVTIPGAPQVGSATTAPAPTVRSPSAATRCRSSASTCARPVILAAPTTASTSRPPPTAPPSTR
jgi:hypothetical protein